MWFAMAVKNKKIYHRILQEKGKIAIRKILKIKSKDAMIRAELFACSVLGRKKSENLNQVLYYTKDSEDLLWH